MKWCPVYNGLISSGPYNHSGDYPFWVSTAGTTCRTCSYTIFTYPPIREDETSGYVDPEDETPANVIVD